MARSLRRRRKKRKKKSKKKEEEAEEKESGNDSTSEYELETLVAIQRSLTSEGRELRANRRNVSERAVAGTDEELEFQDMTESELRFHKYAELKATWERKCVSCQTGSATSIRSRPDSGPRATSQNGMTRP